MAKQRSLESNSVASFASNDIPRPKVWTIAGSDCTAGAGIQADVKTIHSLGGIPATVITAVTAQNHSGVTAINAVSNEVMRSQLYALLGLQDAEIDYDNHTTFLLPDDLDDDIVLPNAIKIGLLANQQQVEIVSEFISQLRDHGHKPVVIFDPVMSATNGDQLTEDDLVETITSTLMPFVDVITPNAKEVQKFTGVFMFSEQCMLRAAEQFHVLGCSSVVIKGGHIDLIENRCIDLGVTFDKESNASTYWLNGAQVDSEHAHGTGCTFASAIATLLASGFHFRDSITVAKALITEGLRASANLSGIYGPILPQGFATQLTAYPRTSRTSPEASPKSSELASSSQFKRLDPHQLTTYPVVDSLEWLQCLLDAGATTVQYRNKTLKGRELDDAIGQAVALGKRYNAQLFINDYWALAIKHNAFGIHLGQEDLAQADLYAIKSADICLGISTHGHFEFLAALPLKPSYLAIGAIFPTQTKDMTGQIQGLYALSKLTALQSSIPVVAIGGITLANVDEVLNAGADSIAVVTAITRSDDPEVAFNDFEQRVTQFRTRRQPNDHQELTHVQ